MVDEYKDQGITFASGNSKWEAGSAPVLTGFKINGVDLANIYEQVASGSATGNATGFKTNNSTYVGQDLDALFSGIGTTVSGDVVFSNPTFDSSIFSIDLLGSQYQARSDIMIFADGFIAKAQQINTVLRPNSWIELSDWIDGFPAGNPNRNSPADFEFRLSGGVGDTPIGDSSTGTNIPTFGVWNDVPTTGWKGFYQAAIGDSGNYISQSRIGMTLEIREKVGTANIASRTSIAIEAEAGGGPIP